MITAIAIPFLGTKTQLAIFVCLAFWMARVNKKKLLMLLTFYSSMALLLIILIFIEQSINPSYTFSISKPFLIILIGLNSTLFFFLYAEYTRMLEFYFLMSKLKMAKSLIMILFFMNYYLRTLYSRVLNATNSYKLRYAHAPFHTKLKVLINMSRALISFSILKVENIANGWRASGHPDLLPFEDIYEYRRDDLRR